jgi:hypothetical protein
MLIREFDEGTANVKKLTALVDFLTGRAQDQNARKQISKAALINAARTVGVNITNDSLESLIKQDPLKNILEPTEPGSDVIKFRGNQEVDTAMSVDTARDIVNKNAKSAMRRAMK